MRALGVITGPHETSKIIPNMAAILMVFLAERQASGAPASGVLLEAHVGRFMSAAFDQSDYYRAHFSRVNQLIAMYFLQF